MKNSISEIITSEWEMFQRVNEGGERALCQEDYDTFYAMREGQFSTWSTEALDSYLMDLKRAGQAGRNLVEEKYIRMMRETSPDSYAGLSKRLETATPEAERLAGEICERMIAQTRDLHERYPNVSGAGRPLYSEADFTGVISVETYQLGELLTYSEKTLSALHSHLMALEAEGVSLAELILTNSVRHYGYGSLGEAESSIEDMQ